MDAGPAQPQSARRWEGRPWLARAVRIGVVAAPIAAAVGCSSLVSRALPTPSTTSGLVTWWAFVLVVSTSALVVTDRFARRLLPLSVLLKLSLPFPDAPPSRIRVAIRSGSPRQLEKWADSVAARGRKDPKAVAAHELLGLVTALSVHDRRSRGTPSESALHGPDGRTTRTVPRRRRQTSMGEPAPRHRQDPGAGRDPEQARRA